MTPQEKALEAAWKTWAGYHDSEAERLEAACVAYAAALSETPPTPRLKPWSCDICDARCNYEAMNLCVRRTDNAAECGFDRDRPESLGGCFEFVSPSDATPTPSEEAITCGQCGGPAVVVARQHVWPCALDGDTVGSETANVRCTCAPQVSRLKHREARTTTPDPEMVREIARATLVEWVKAEAETSSIETVVGRVVSRFSPPSGTHKEGK